MAIDAIARGIAGAARVGLAQANEKIDRLEGKTTRILYTAKTNPTATEIGDFVNSLGYTSPYEGVAVVVAGTYHIWHYYENDGIGWRDDGVDTITPFTNSVPGSILGSTDSGKISANPDGTGSVNGWDDKLDKQTGTTTYRQAYVKAADGTQTMVNMTNDTLDGGIVLRANAGHINLPNANDYTPALDQAISKRFAENNFLAKQTGSTTYAQAYIKNTDGTQTLVNLMTAAGGNAIPLRTSAGFIYVPVTPTQSDHAASKGYVDGKLTATLTQLSDGTYSLTFGV